MRPLGVSDQAASAALRPLIVALREVLTRHGALAVLTHPYEGGHPDHDATAFIASRAGLPLLEFASYHADPAGGLAIGRFLPGLAIGRFLPDAASLRLDLTCAEQARKRRMLDCFTTQAATLAPFGTGWEMVRPRARL